MIERAGRGRKERERVRFRETNYKHFNDFVMNDYYDFSKLFFKYLRRLHTSNRYRSGLGFIMKA